MEPATIVTMKRSVGPISLTPSPSMSSGGAAGGAVAFAVVQLTVWLPTQNIWPRVALSALLALEAPPLELDMAPKSEGRPVESSASRKTLRRQRCETTSPYLFEYGVSLFFATPRALNETDVTT